MNEIPHSEGTHAPASVGSREQELTRILNGLPAMIGRWDRGLRNTFANDAYSDYFGKSPEQIRGMHLRDLLGPALFDLNEPYVRGVLGGVTQTFERDIPLPVGGSRATLAQYVPDVVDGQVRGFFVIVSDLSELKRLERERRQIESRVLFAARLSALGEMAGGIAHEVNNPLAIIVGTLAQIRILAQKNSLTNAHLNALLADIEATALRISKIVRALRAFARDAEGEPQTVCPVRWLIDETLSLCRQRFLHHGVQLRERPVDEALAILGRPTQISQALINLLNNAFDASVGERERWIEVAAVDAGDQVEISVGDSGAGVPLSLREKIFVPFFTTKEVGRGAGLGLSVARGLAEAHGGELCLDEASPHTRFLLRLPKAPARGALVSVG